LTEKTQATTDELPASERVGRAAQRVVSRRPGRTAIFGASATLSPPAQPSRTPRPAAGGRAHQARVRDRLAELSEEIEALAAQVAKLNQRQFERPR
jgi:hypothetical protein